MTTIRETVLPITDRTGVARGNTIIEEAVVALEKRESAIVDALRAYAEGRGLDRMEQDRILSNVGLGQYAEDEEPEDLTLEDDGTLESAIRQIHALTQKVDSLERLAAQVRLGL